MVAPNQIVEFRTKAPHDMNLHQGTVVGVVTYSLAKNVSDVAGYHAEVAKVETGIASVDLMEFIVIRKDQEEYAFAADWIEAPTFRQVDPGATYTIEIYNTSLTDAQNALKLLRDNNFASSLK